MLSGFPMFIALVVCVAGGGILGYFFGKGGGRNATPGEYKQALVAGLIPGAIIGAALGAVFSIFSIIQMGFSGLLSTLILVLVCGAGGAGGLGFANVIRTWLVNAMGPGGAGALSGILFGGLLFCFVMFVANPATGGAFEQYWGAGWDPVWKVISDAAKELYKWRYCFVADPHCPFFIDWSDAKVQSDQEALQVNVEFKQTQIKNDYVNALIELSVKNPEKYELHLIPKCFLGETFEKSRPINLKNMGTYAQGYEFVFPMSADTMSTSLRCDAEVTECMGKAVCLDQRIFLVLERPVLLQGVWPIYIGKEYPITGPKQVFTELKFNVPYSVTLYSSNDLPFDQGKKDGYDFNLAIKQRDEETQIKSIERIRLTFPDNIIASCQEFGAEGNDLVIENIDEDWLKQNIQYDPEEKSYIFPCNLQVKNAPISAVLAPVGIEATYTVISKFEGKITKQPAQ